jgi:hypothetical protein
VATGSAAALLFKASPPFPPSRTPHAPASADLIFMGFWGTLVASLGVGRTFGLFQSGSAAPRQILNLRSLRRWQSRLHSADCRCRNRHGGAFGPTRFLDRSVELMG